jgi:hypothetical protein
LLVPANLLGHSTGGTFEFDASVGSKLFVTLSFVFPFRIIKRIVSERTEGLNFQPHSEQAKPRKFSLLIHSSLRSNAAL